MVIFNSYVSLPEDNHLEKYEFVNGKDDIPYMKWEKMFQTTNQYIYMSSRVYGESRTGRHPGQIPKGRTVSQHSWVPGHVRSQPIT